MASLSFLEGFRFMRGVTVIHRLDPRTKMIYIVCMLAMSMLSDSIGFLLALFISIIPIILIAKVERLWLKTLRGSIFLIILVFTLNLLPLLGGGLTIALEKAVAMVARLLTLMSAFSIFFMTTYPEDFTEALLKLKVPYDFTLTFTMALRFVPTLVREAQIIIDAQRARGLELEGGSLMKRIRNCIPIIIPLIVNAIRRSTQIADAMEARAFGAKEVRTSIHEVKMGGIDYIAIVAMATAMGITLYILHLL